MKQCTIVFNYFVQLYGSCINDNDKYRAVIGDRDINVSLILDSRSDIDSQFGISIKSCLLQRYKLNKG